MTILSYASRETAQPALPRAKIVSGFMIGFTIAMLVLESNCLIDFTEIRYTMCGTCRMNANPILLTFELTGMAFVPILFGLFMRGRSLWTTTSRLCLIAIITALLFGVAWGCELHRFIFMLV